jgi:hypothetical protein
VPARAQRADGTENPVLAVPRHRPTGEAGADEPADAGSGEGETVLPGWESEPAEQEHRQQRLGGHDQSGDEQLVEVERPQAGMGQKVPPAVEQLAGPGPGVAGSPWVFFGAADRGDAQRGEQVAERVGQHSGDRPEQAGRRTAQRWPDGDGTPRRRLEPRVGHEQVLRPDERLEVGAAGRGERDLGRRDHGRDDEQLHEGEPAEGVRDRDGQHGREPGQVHRDHHRPLGVELHPRTERQRDERADRRPHR